VKRQELNQLFALNRKLFKAYLLKESLDRMWSYRYEGAMVRYLKQWIDQLCWQRLEPFRKLSRMLIDHIDGILNYCRTRVPLGVVEAVNGNIKSLSQRMAVCKDRIRGLQESGLICETPRFLRRAVLFNRA
jgi:transposase